MDVYARYRLDAIRKLNYEGFSVMWRDALDEQRARLDAADRLAEAAGHAVHSGVGPDSFVHRMADLTRALTEYEEARDV